MSNKPKGAKSKGKELTPEQIIHQSLVNEGDLKKVAKSTSAILEKMGENREAQGLVMAWEKTFMQKLSALNAYALQYSSLDKKYIALLKKYENKNAKPNKS